MLPQRGEADRDRDRQRRQHDDREDEPRLHLDPPRDRVGPRRDETPTAAANEGEHEPAGERQPDRADRAGVPVGARRRERRHERPPRRPRRGTRPRRRSDSGRPGPSARCPSPRRRPTPSSAAGSFSATGAASTSASAIDIATVECPLGKLPCSVRACARPERVEPVQLGLQHLRRHVRADEQRRRRERDVEPPPRERDRHDPAAEQDERRHVHRVDRRRGSRTRTRGEAPCALAAANTRASKAAPRALSNASR